MKRTFWYLRDWNEIDKVSFLLFSLGSDVLLILGDQINYILLYMELIVVGEQKSIYHS